MNISQYFIGYGVGLRRSHFESVLKQEALVPDWFEIISENYMTFGGTPRKVLETLKQRKVPIISHGVGLSLGSIDDLNQEYLTYLKDLNDWLDVPWFSDHLCFSSSMEHHYHDLLPILLTPESLVQIVDRIKKVEDIFQRPFAIENISYYGASSHNTISESDFINEVLHRTNSFLLLDINNVYVNAKNHNFDPWNYLMQINSERIIQIHLAGHKDRGDIIIDTHGEKICDEVWDLYGKYIAYLGRQVSTLIEWDSKLPKYEVLLDCAKQAQMVAQSALGIVNE